MQSVMASVVPIILQLLRWPILRVIPADDFLLFGFVTLAAIYYLNNEKENSKNGPWYERPQQLIHNGSQNSSKVDTRDISTRLEQTVCIGYPPIATRHIDWFREQRFSFCGLHNPARQKILPAT